MQPKYYTNQIGDVLTHYGPVRADLVAAGWVESDVMPPKSEAARVAEIEAAADALIDAALPPRAVRRMMMRGQLLNDARHARPLDAAESAERDKLISMAEWSEAVHAEAARLIDGGHDVQEAAWPALPA